VREARRLAEREQEIGEDDDRAAERARAAAQRAGEDQEDARPAERAERLPADRQQQLDDRDAATDQRGAGQRRDRF